MGVVDETWTEPATDQQPGGDDAEEDWGESAPVQSIREVPLPAKTVAEVPPLTGKVLSFDAATGYGFIDGGAGIGRVLVNRAGLGGTGVDRLQKDQPVRFTVTEDAGGRKSAAIVDARLPYIVRPVFFATDRKFQDSKTPSAIFSNEYGGTLQYGITEVAIPYTHQLGQLESPRMWKLEFRADPRKHVTVFSVERCAGDNFFTRLGAMVDRSTERQALVFVHGFRVSFDDAVRRAAQLAQDLKIDGPAIAYSWSSHADLNCYHEDATTNERTIPFLEAFLADVAGKSGATSIYLIAHSMGNRALTYALDRLARSRQAGAPALFREAILAAPDIDRNVFEQLATGFRGTAERFTIYASSHDLALTVSKHINGYTRLGDVQDGMAVIAGMDSIDASAVDTSLVGHSYYGDQRSVLDDIFELVTARLPAARRFNLEPTGPCWRFKG